MAKEEDMTCECSLVMVVVDDDDDDAAAQEVAGSSHDEAGSGSTAAPCSCCEGAVAVSGVRWCWL